MPTQPASLPKMMLGFVVRRCAVAVGHEPSAEEFAAWANNYEEGGRVFHLFGRPISVSEAQVILRHRARPVSARSAAPQERVPPDDPAALRPGANVTSLAAAAARLGPRRRSKA